MDTTERSRDVYEQVPAYAGCTHPQPPLVPLPEPGSLDNLYEIPLKPDPVTRWIVKNAMTAVGFKAFQEQLPDKIEGFLRQQNLRIPGLFSPVLSATLALADDPRNPSPIERAATLLFGARSLYDDLMSGKLPPDQYRGQALEMGQYPNLFSTSLVLDKHGVRIFKSTVVDHIIVVFGRRFYQLKIGNLGTATTAVPSGTIEQLKDALSKLVEKAQQNRLRADEPSPGVLTCGMDQTQWNAFIRLQKLPENQASLVALRNSFLTLCLDLESSPASHAEATFIGQSTNCANRWYHSSLQLVVFGNAKACVICNFTTYLAGNTMMRGAAEIQKRAIEIPINRVTQNELALGIQKPIPLPPAKELKWQLNYALVRRAMNDLKMVQDNQPATFEIHDLGRKFFSLQKIDAVPAFILALQLTSRRLTGNMVKISQLLTMSKYRCMDLATAVVTTPEVEKFVNYIERGDPLVASEPSVGSESLLAKTIQPFQAKELMRQAIESQDRECRKARSQLNLKVILTLFIRSQKGARRWFVLFIGGITVILLRLLGLIKSGVQEVVVSHPEIYPQVPVVGRPGIRLPYVKYFGLHYQILDEKIVITMMPGLEWPIPNAEFIAELNESLRQIRLIVEAT